MAFTRVRETLSTAADMVLNPVDDQFIGAVGFTERARLAAGIIEPRTILTPTYLTDLGVRRFTDLTTFYRLNARLIPGLDEQRRSVRIDAGSRTESDVDLDAVASILDAVVVFWGDYDLAENLARSLGSQTPMASSYTFLTYSAHLHAATTPALAVKLLLMAKKSAATPTLAFTSDLRRSAIVLKRQRDPEGARKLLRTVRDGLTVLTETHQATSSDVATMSAMTLNLEALALIRLGQAEDAWEAITHARDAIRASGLNIVGEPEARRYRTQIVGNAARLAWLLERRKLALQLWRENHETASQDDHYSRGETTFGLAYGLYLSGDYDASAVMARAAALRICREAGPDRLAVARKVWAAAAARAGRMDEARWILATEQKDPLGLGLLDERLEADATSPG